MSKSALVGSTGFVGQTLQRQLEFDALFNSQNSFQMQGERFGTVYFSAARAEKWKANANPELDAEHIDSLISLMKTFRADRLVLISTVDVYAHPIGVDETTPIALTTDLHPYGLNRFRLEEAACGLFDSVIVVRLPALFGEGLKKNVVYDLLHENNLDQVNPNGEFQFYDVQNLTHDIERCSQLGLTLLNVCSEPLQVRTMANEVFGIDLDTRDFPNSPKYDVRSVHAEAWGAHDYLYSAEHTMRGLAGFVRHFKGQGAQP